MQFGQWHGCRLLSVYHTQCIRVIDRRSMTQMPTPGFFAPLYRAVNDTNAVWSMTRMQIAECISHSVHLCHWPLVNDTNADTCTIISHYRAVNDTNDNAYSFVWITLGAFVSLTTGQWPECRLLSVNYTQFAISLETSSVNYFLLSLEYFWLSLNYFYLSLNYFQLGVIYSQCNFVIDRVIDWFYTIQV